MDQAHEDLDKLARVSRALYSKKEELMRYEQEGYLNNEEMGPSLVVALGNHPTYLSDFKVHIHRKQARKVIKEIMLAEFRDQIRVLKAELKILKGK